MVSPFDDDIKSSRNSRLYYNNLEQPPPGKSIRLQLQNFKQRATLVIIYSLSTPLILYVSLLTNQ